MHVAQHTSSGLLLEIAKECFCELLLNLWMSYAITSRCSTRDRRDKWDWFRTRNVCRRPFPLTTACCVLPLISPVRPMLCDITESTEHRKYLWDFHFSPSSFLVTATRVEWGRSGTSLSCEPLGNIVYRSRNCITPFNEDQAQKNLSPTRFPVFIHPPPFSLFFSFSCVICLLISLATSVLLNF